MKNLKKTLLFTSMFVAASAQAEISLNGFASVVAGTTTSSDETLYGYDDTIDFSNGSLFALQASGDIGDGLSVTAQIISRGEDDWDPKFEWAYASYEATDNLRILAGRQRVPFYMFSDFLDVSYAYAWIDPPKGVYNVPFDTFDGLGAIYNTSFGEFDTTFHFIYGGNNSDIDDETPADFNDLAGLAVTLNRDWLTLRAAYVQTEMNIEVGSTQPLVNGWNSLGQTHIADEIEIAGDTGAFVELGFQLDFDNIIVIGEYSQLTLDGTALPGQDSFYVMAGYRFSNMLAHITYGADENVHDGIRLDYNIPGIPPGTPPEFLPPELQALIAGTQSIEGTTEDSNYITLGLRWDFHDSAALKFEYTTYSDDINTMADAGLFRTALVTVF